MLADRERRRLLQLATAQDRAFELFARFAAPDQAGALAGIGAGADATILADIRARIAGGDEEFGVTAEAWYELTTRRIDALKLMEDGQADALRDLCARAIAEERSGAASRPEAPDSAPIALLVTPSDSPVGAPGGGVDLCALDETLPRPLRSMMEILEAQSRALDDASGQLESARAALRERKLVERAKGLLMSRRKLSESDAYSLIRQTAMSQNRRMAEVAEAIVSATDLLKPSR